MMTPASPAETADAIRLTALAVCTFFEGGAAVRCAVAAAACGRAAAAPGAGGAGRAGVRSTVRDGRAASRADHVRRGDLTAAPLADGLAHRLFIDRTEAGA